MTVYWFMMAWVILFGILAQATSKRVCVGEYLGEEVYEARAFVYGGCYFCCDCVFCWNENYCW